MVHRARFGFVCVTLMAATAVAMAGCDNGATPGNGGSTGSTSTGSPTSTTTGNPTSSTTASGNPTGGSNPGVTSSTTGASSSGTSSALMCPMAYCAATLGGGDGGYAFSYADDQNPPPQAEGTSMAALAADGSMCISGQVGLIGMLNGMPDYSDDWGCGIGVNLNQMMATTDAGPPIMSYTFTGTGVTVNTTAVPACTTARVVLDQDGTNAVCAPLTPGVEIPWATFNTTCWAPTTGTPLAGPPSSQALKIQLVTSGSMTAPCVFTDFCITGLTAK